MSAVLASLTMSIISTVLILASVFKDYEFLDLVIGFIFFFFSLFILCFVFLGLYWLFHALGFE